MIDISKVENNTRVGTGSKRSTTAFQLATTLEVQCMKPTLVLVSFGSSYGNNSVLFAPMNIIGKIYA